MTTKKEKILKQLDDFEDKYFNKDQKEIAKKIINNVPEEQVQQYADFIFMKRRTGFAFDYSPEIAKGRLITLKEDKKKRINVNDEVTDDENKLIIGDNYNALKSLLITHKEKIDIIYIDPPYNTESAKNDGNQSSKEGTSEKFVYKDKFGRGGWLNMMKDRLILAKDLLTPKGVIFVSIDDNEQAYLKVLMDDIFGEENFISNLGWLKHNAQNDAHNFQKNYEYILVYAKNKEKKIIKLNRQINKNIGDLIGLTIGGGVKSKALKFHPDTGQTIYWNKNSNKLIIKKDYDFKKVKTGYEKLYEVYKDDPNLIKKGFVPIRPPSFFFEGKQYLGRWTWGIEKMEENINNLVVKNNKKNNIQLFRRDIREFTNNPFKNFIEGISSSKGTILLKSILNDNFSNPKPIELLSFLIGSIENKNAIILDFFAGSGTTGHVVMELNRKDNGNRKFIINTNNENNIAFNITYERLHRVMRGVGTNGDNKFKWLEKNKPFTNEKLRVINIDDSIKISLDQNISDEIFENAKNGIKLLDGKYNKKDLNLYYDLAAMNPLDE